MTHIRAEWEQQRVRQLEQAVGAKVIWEDGRQTHGNPVFQLPSGKRFSFGIPLTSRERALVELWLNGQEMSRRERKSAFRDWLCQLKAGNEAVSVPPEIAELPWKGRVPFFLESLQPVMTDHELEEFVKTYFAGHQAWVFRVGEREWLLFVSLSDLVEGECERVEGGLYQAAEGLVEAFANEAGVEVRLMVHPPLEKASDLLPMWREVSQGMELMRCFYPERRTLSTWKLGLEKILHGLRSEKERAILECFPSLDLLKEKEMSKTLEAFFQFDLNISETARHLFIHRNTLLYRLDRFKQETGLDVRTFEDAVLAKITLLLLKKIT